MPNLLEDRDRNLISGLFLENNISQDKLWLTKYFSSDIQIRFLMYYTIFNSHFYFVRHTGICCTTRYLKKMKKKFYLLEKAHREAKANFDLETLSEIEMGNYKVQYEP